MESRDTEARTRESDGHWHQRFYAWNRRAGKFLRPRIWLFIISGLLLASSIQGQRTAEGAHKTANQAKVLAAEDTALVHQNSSLILQVRAQAKAIQQSRFNSCEDQNARHDHTIQVLDRVLKDFVRNHPNEAKQAIESRADNVFLINALLPKRDCSKLNQPATSRPSSDPPTVPPPHKPHS